MSRTVEALTTQECLMRLRDHDVARVSISIRAMPVIIPVLYRVDGDSVLFGAPLDPTLPASCDGAVIAFEVDDFSSTSALLWSVMIVGVATLLSDQELRLPITPGAATFGPAGRLVGLRLERLTGHKSIHCPSTPNRLHPIEIA